MSENQSASSRPDGAAQGPSQQEFGLQKIYTRDISYKAPNTPAVFLKEWKPETNVQLNTQSRALDDPGVYEVELTLTVTAQSQGQTAYLVEVKQAGVFRMRGIPEDQMGPLLSAYCPNILFPFAREVVSDLVTRGGFPQLLLAPVNFDALYAQRLREQQAARGDGDGRAKPAN
ncbi:MAG: protein-export chaperone SecB [Ectothiorhodospira sp.]